MNIVATSDLHGALPDIPPCDLLLIAGDTPPVQGSHDPIIQAAWMETEFKKWLVQQPVSRSILIAGNHDFWLETGIGRATANRLPLTYLEDSSVRIDDLTIYGTPWTPNLPGWAFQKDGTEARAAFERIPERVDILLSHGPPAGYGDRVSLSHVGSPELLEVVRAKRPRIMVCGHIHEGYGNYRIGDATEVYCVSHMDRNYRPINAPVQFDV